MTDNRDHADAERLEAIRAEFESLRARVADFAKTAKSKEAEAADKLMRELDYCRDIAIDGAEKLRDFGSDGIDDIRSRIREHPVTSLLIAFGVGCLVSRLTSTTR